MTNTENTTKAAINVLRVTPAGEVEELAFNADDTLNGLYNAIDCRMVDVVEITEGLDMWLDDEGLLVEEPEVNVPACLVAVAVGALRQPLAGTVVFASHNGEGEMTSLAPEMTRAIRAVIADGP